MFSIICGYSLMVSKICMSVARDGIYEARNAITHGLHIYLNGFRNNLFWLGKLNLHLRLNLWRCHPTMVFHLLPWPFSSFYVLFWLDTTVMWLYALECNGFGSIKLILHIHTMMNIELYIHLIFIHRMATAGKQRFNTVIFVSNFYLKIKIKHNCKCENLFKYSVKTYTLKWAR